MPHSNRNLTEAPSLPGGAVEAFRLDGNYEFQGPHLTTAFTLRGTRILERMILSPEKTEALRAVSIDLDHTYGGEPARCFIPRHGLSFFDGMERAEILICLECLWIYFFRDENPVVATLSRAGRASLEKLFTDAFKSA